MKVLPEVVDFLNLKDIITLINKGEFAQVFDKAAKYATQRFDRTIANEKKASLIQNLYEVLDASGIKYKDGSWWCRLASFIAEYTGKSVLILGSTEAYTIVGFTHFEWFDSNQSNEWNFDYTMEGAILQDRQGNKEYGTWVTMQLL